MNKLIAVMAFLFLFNGPASAENNDKWQQVNGDHFLIYYRDVPEDFVQQVLNSAEEEFQIITDNFGITRYQSWRWENRAKIYIYRDQEDYQKNARQAQWSHGGALVSSKTIETFPSASGFFDSILPHELAHIIFREYIGLKPIIPLWFEEGVAMYQEKAKRWGVNKEVIGAKEKGQFIPLTDLSDMRLYSTTDAAAVELFYSEAASAVYFMITELGESNFYRLLNRLKDGMRFGPALEDVYTRVKNTDDLNKQWQQYLDDQQS